jgi:hypothetical protein
MAAIGGDDSGSRDATMITTERTNQPIRSSAVMGSTSDVWDCGSFFKVKEHCTRVSEHQISVVEYRSVP